MDTSIRYDQYPSSDIAHGLKFIPQRGLYGKVVYILYGVLVLLLLILLLITGLKFSQLNKDLADVKLSLLTLDKSVKDRKAASINSGSIEKLVHDYDESMIPERGPCDEGWMHHHTSCYFFSKSEVNWHEAEDLCHNHEAHLAVLNTVNKLEYISKMLNDGQLYWIGLVERDTEGKWSWVDGTDFKTSEKFWDKGQPDNWDYRVDGEDCAQIHGIKRGQTYRHWNDADCSLNYRYICEAQDKSKPS
ncbi:hepatic lectin-like [Osmerus mordax]|uniref:hepatic lectin-like n=1 Tax=Osmerus mordax TaxID=8014 RepID=UPI003510CBC7